MLPSSSQASRLSRLPGFHNRKSVRVKVEKKDQLQKQIKDKEDKEKDVEFKKKNTTRALTIAKTLFGMVDELDSTDFGA